jgi:hypothetical protein
MVKLLKTQRLSVILGALFIASTLCWGQVAADHIQDVTALLDYRESGGSATGRIVFDDDLELVKVPATPTSSDAATLRGYLKTDPRPENCMAFFWHIDQQKLYLDLNLNRDLTDDPNGVYANQETGNPKNYQRFHDIHIVIPRQGINYPYHLGTVSLNCYGQGHTSGYVSIHCGYHAQITLGAQYWDFTISEDLDGALTGQDWMQIRPSQSGGQSASFSIPKALFLNDRGYAVDSKFVSDDRRAQIQLSLLPRELPLGQLHLTGKHLAYLLFKSSDVTVPVFNPEETPVTMPAGSYSCDAIRLDPGLNRARIYPNRLELTVTVTTDQITTFRAGAPLKPVITASRAGPAIKLDFELHGQAGETYQVNNREQRPGFAVYKGPLKIDSGQFEYG